MVNDKLGNKFREAIIKYGMAYLKKESVDITGSKMKTVEGRICELKDKPEQNGERKEKIQQRG